MIPSCHEPSRREHCSCWHAGGECCKCGSSRIDPYCTESKLAGKDFNLGPLDTPRRQKIRICAGRIFPGRGGVVISCGNLEVMFGDEDFKYLGSDEMDPDASLWLGELQSLSARGIGGDHYEPTPRAKRVLFGGHAKPGEGYFILKCGDTELQIPPKLFDRLIGDSHFDNSKIRGLKDWIFALINDANNGRNGDECQGLPEEIVLDGHTRPPKVFHTPTPKPDSTDDPHTAISKPSMSFEDLIEGVPVEYTQQAWPGPAAPVGLEGLQKSLSKIGVSFGEFAKSVRSTLQNAHDTVNYELMDSETGEIKTISISKEESRLLLKSYDTEPINNSCDANNGPITIANITLRDDAAAKLNEYVINSMVLAYRDVAKKGGSLIDCQMRAAIAFRELTGVTLRDSNSEFLELDEIK